MGNNKYQEDSAERRRDWMQASTLVVWSSLATVAVETVVAAYFWRRRGSIHAGGAFAVVVALAALNPLLYLLQLSAEGLGPAVFWRQLSGLAGIATVGSILVFAAVYTRRDWVFRSRGFYALATALGAAFLVRTTNALPGWPGVHAAWAEGVRSTTVGGLTTLSLAYGPAYWPYLLAVVAAQLTAVAFVVEFALRPEQRLYRRQNVALSVGVATPIAASIAQPAVDTVFLLRGPGALVGVALLAAAVARFGVFDAVPVTRGGILDEIDDGVVVFDDRGRILDANDRAAALLGIDGGGVGRQLRPQLTDRFGLDADRDLDAQLAGGTFAVDDDGDPRYVETRVSTVTDDRGRPLSRALLLYDVTARERRRRRLRSERDATRAIHDALVDRSSLSVFARTVCEELAALEAVTFAWIGTGGSPEEVEPLASAGGGGYLDAIHAGESPADPPPGVATLRQGVPVGVAVDPEGPPWARAAAERGAVAAVAVPAAHDGVVRGVVVAHLSTGAVAEEGRVRVLLEDAADVLGHVLGATERRRALVADDRVELTVEVGGEDDPLVRAAGATGATAAVTGATPRTDATVLIHLRVPAGAVEGFLAGLDDAPAVRSASRLDDARTDVDGGRVALQAVVETPTPRTVLAEHGGTVVGETVSGDGRTATARFPRGTDFDPVVAALERSFGSARIREYRSVEESADRESDPLAAATDRQREVLAAAYRAGYFEYPRGQTATDLAEQLDVSRPTLQEILRASQRNVFEALFEDERDRP